jgi:hypothetical protein
MLSGTCGQHRVQYKVSPDWIEAEMTLESMKTSGVPTHLKPLMVLWIMSEGTRS